MTTLNDARRCGRAAGAHALTDVTGFGLLGHLHELASGLGRARRRSPLRPSRRSTGVLELLADERAVAGGSRRNRADADTFTTWGDAVPEPRAAGVRRDDVGRPARRGLATGPVRSTAGSSGGSSPGRAGDDCRDVSAGRGRGRFRYLWSCQRLHPVRGGALPLAREVSGRKLGLSPRLRPRSVPRPFSTAGFGVARRCRAHRRQPVLAARKQAAARRVKRAHPQARDHPASRALTRPPRSARSSALRQPGENEPDEQARDATDDAGDPDAPRSSPAAAARARRRSPARRAGRCRPRGRGGGRARRASSRRRAGRARRRWRRSAMPSPATSTATYAPPAPVTKKTSSGAHQPWRRSSSQPNSAIAPTATTS